MRCPRWTTAAAGAAGGAACRWKCSWESLADGLEVLALVGEVGQTSRADAFGAHLQLQLFHLLGFGALHSAQGVLAELTAAALEVGELELLHISSAQALEGEAGLESVIVFSVGGRAFQPGRPVLGHG